MDVLRQEQEVSAWQRKYAPARAPFLGPLAIDAPLVSESDILLGSIGARRPAIEVAGNAVVTGIRKEVEPICARPRTIHDQLNEPVFIELPILVREIREFGINDLVALSVERSFRVPVGEGDEARGTQTEQHDIDEHDAKC